MQCVWILCITVEDESREGKDKQSFVTRFLPTLWLSPSPPLLSRKRMLQAAPPSMERPICRRGKEPLSEVVGWVVGSMKARGRESSHRECNLVFLLDRLSLLLLPPPTHSSEPNLISCSYSSSSLSPPAFLTLLQIILLQQKSDRRRKRNKLLYRSLCTDLQGGSVWCKTVCCYCENIYFIWQCFGSIIVSFGIQILFRDGRTCRSTRQKSAQSGEAWSEGAIGKVGSKGKERRKRRGKRLISIWWLGQFALIHPSVVAQLQKIDVFFLIFCPLFKSCCISKSQKHSSCTAFISDSICTLHRVPTYLHIVRM